MQKKIQYCRMVREEKRRMDQNLGVAGHEVRKFMLQM